MFQLRILLILGGMIGSLQVYSQCNAPFQVLHYTETTGYDHNTRGFSQAMFQYMGLELGFTLVTDNDGTKFNELDTLQKYAVIIFSNTSGASGLDSLQRANMEAYMSAGGSFIGIHAAGDTYRHSTANGNNTGVWDWYAETLTGASVRMGPSHTHWSHIDTMSKAGQAHPVTDSIPDPWIKQEEYYYWENGYLDPTFNPVLYVAQTGSNSYDLPRMMAQIKELPSGGRSFYTGLGHAPSNYTGDTLFFQLLSDAVRWTAQPNLPSSLDYSLLVVSPQCTNNGSISVVPADSATAYTYSWSTGESSSSISGLGQGLYSVTISDSSGCVVTDSVILNSVASPEITLSITDSISCDGGSDGTITVSAGAGTAPYQITWANGDTNLIRSNLPSGNYTAIVTDSLGCTAIDSLFLPEPPDLIATMIQTDSISCFGFSDGAATIIGTGGTGPYAYFWPNGDTIAVRSFLPAGTYFATITDENGCTASDSLSIIQPDSLQANLHILTPILCSGSSTGSVMVSGIGGTAPYSFFWANGDTSTLRSALPAGGYTVTVTDANGCSVTDSILLVGPPELSAAGIITDSISCFGGSDGGLTGQATGGVSPYSYTWGNGDTAQSRSGLPSGGYFLTVTDLNGCTDSVTLIVPEPSQLSADILVVDSISCTGGSDGGILATASGGTGNIHFFWANGDSTALRSGLTAGTYVVTAIDQNGCTAAITATLPDPPPLVFQLLETQTVSCFGGSNGEITAYGQGGKSPYQIFWGNGDSSFIRSNLPAGTYFATLMDEEGCTSSDSLTLQPGPVISLLLSVVQDIVCLENETASVQAAASGGVPPYSYLWGHGDTSSNPIGLAGGLYSVTVTDSVGCTAIDSILVSSPEVLVPLILQTASISCAGSSDASLEGIATGGESPYSFMWEDGSIQPIRSNIDTGMYMMQVTDSRGCQKIDTLIVTEPDSLTATVTSVPDSSCTSIGNGSITVTSQGGTQPVWVYLIDSEGNEVALDSLPVIVFQELEQGWYNILLQDEAFCDYSDSIEVVDACLQGDDLEQMTSLERFDFFQRPDGVIQVHIIFSTPQIARLSVHTIHGQIIEEQDLQGQHLMLEIADSTLSEGIYVISLLARGVQLSRTMLVR